MWGEGGCRGWGCGLEAVVMAKLIEWIRQKFPDKDTYSVLRQIVDQIKDEDGGGDDTVTVTIDGDEVELKKLSAETKLDITNTNTDPYSLYEEVGQTRRDRTYSFTASARFQNAGALREFLDRLRTCPECDSRDYVEIETEGRVIQRCEACGLERRK